MDETGKLISFHLSCFPGMEMQDCIKLLYQNEFGAAHLADDDSALLAGLLAEWDSFELRSPEPEPSVPIGNGLCRVPLGRLAEGLSAETFARLCFRASQNATGSIESFEKKLAIFQEMVNDGKTPFSWGQVRDFLTRYRAEGFLPLPHSERFRALYQPHYRLLDVTSDLFLPVYAAIDGALTQKPHVLVGIDGMSGAGKSGLAGALEEVYGCAVVHADDFFIRKEQRSPARYAQPGGNIDYERLAPVAAKAADDRAFSYQAYDCKCGQLGEWRHLPEARVTVIEGAYSLHPSVGALYDIRVFLGVDARRQRARICKRNGSGQLDDFLNRWIPMENSYSAAFGIRESCDIILDTTPLDSELF